MAKRWSAAWVLASAGLLAGCGGAGGGEGTPTTGGGPGGFTSTEERGTARVDVDTQTGQVTVTPLNKPGTASNQTNTLFTGSAVQIKASALSLVPGETAFKKMNLTITNETDDEIVNGKIIFDRIINDNLTNVDLREFAHVETLIGPGTSGSDGPPSSVTINQPTGLAVSGTKLYIASSGDGSLRKLDDNWITRLDTGLVQPGGVALSSTNNLYVVEQAAHRIARYQNEVRLPDSIGNGTPGDVDGTLGAVRLNTPRDIIYANGFTWVSDTLNDKIKKGTGNPMTSLATFAVTPPIPRPSGLGYRASYLYVTSTQTNRIYMVHSETGASTVIAGSGSAGSADGFGPAAQFNSPFDVVPISEDAVYVSDLGGRRIRQLIKIAGADPLLSTSWLVKTIAGTGANGSLDGGGNVAEFGSPRFLIHDVNKGLYLSDLTNNRIRAVHSANGVFPIDGALGNGGGMVEIMDVTGYLPDPSPAAPKKPYIALNMTDQDGEIVPIKFKISSSVKHFSFVVTIEGEATVSHGDAVVSTTTPRRGSPNMHIRTLAGTRENDLIDASLLESRFRPGNHDVLERSGQIYVVETASASIRLVDGTRVSTVMGLVDRSGTGTPLGGNGSTCVFRKPAFLTSNGSEMFLTDLEGHVVYRITGSGSSASSYQVSIIAGTPNTSGNAVGTGSTALFNGPAGIATDATGDIIYVADSGNNSVKRLIYKGGSRSDPASWEVRYYAGDPSGSAGDANGLGDTARFRKPMGLCRTTATDLFISEEDGCRVRRITSDRMVSLIAGSTTAQTGYEDAIGSAARFVKPGDLHTDNTGYLYVADKNMIRRVTAQTGEVKTVAGVSDGSGALVDGYANATSLTSNGETVRFWYSNGRRLLFASDSLVRVIQNVVRQGT